MANQDIDMITFEKKIVVFQKESDEVQKSVVRGSDEHLDILLSVQKPLNQLNEKFADFLDDIIPSSNKLSNEQVEKSMPALLDLYSSLIKLVATLKRSQFNKDLSSSSSFFYSQVESLRELIYDLDHFRLNDPGVDQLLTEINSL